MNKATRLGLLALLSTAYTVGCSCDETTPTGPVTVRFEAPAQGATLGCLQDVDREGTLAIIEIDVEAAIDLVGTDPGALVARLRIQDADGAGSVGEIGEDGLVRFLAFALEVGEIVLVVEVLDGEEIIASAVRDVLVEYNADDPDCQGTQATVTFVAPQGPLGADADGDGDLGNGLQVDVVLEIDGTATGPATLTVNGAAAGEADFEGDSLATFAGVTFDIGSGANTINLAAAIPTAGGEVNVEHSVDIAIDA